MEASVAVGKAAGSACLQPAGSVARVQHAARSGDGGAARRGTAVLLCCGLLAAVGVSSCSTSPSAAPKTGPAVVTFDDQGGQPQPCMTHQQQQPTPAYRAGGTAVSEVELPMLAYYTANGDKPYCDGHPPSATDRAWLALYVSDGAERVHVQRYVG